MPTVDYSVVGGYQRIAGDPVARPMLVVRLHRPPHPPFQTLAIVDSGADTSAFHISIATQLGIDLAMARRATTIALAVRPRRIAQRWIWRLKGFDSPRRFASPVRSHPLLPSSVATTCFVGSGSDSTSKRSCCWRVLTPSKVDR